MRAPSRNRSAGLFLVAALALSACATTNTSTVSPSAFKPTRTRLAHVSWQGNEAIAVCTRRIDDNAQTIGVAGPCYKADLKKPGVMEKVVEWLSAGPRDNRSPDWSPWPTCGFEIVDAQLVPEEKPAKIFLKKPRGREDYYTWAPPPGATADAYVLEPSISPDGKMLAIIRLQLGIGEGMRIVEPEGIELRPLPDCR